ncbi:unnamed protein product [Spodoptera exigua]|nr:unnamed protein product [Spodoptera exigua]
MLGMGHMDNLDNGGKCSFSTQSSGWASQVLIPKSFLFILYY